VRVSSGMAFLAACLLAGAAAADEPPAPLALKLSCAGTEAVMQQTGSTTTVTVKPGYEPSYVSAAHRAAVREATASTSTTTTPVYSQARVPAQMSIAIEGERVRVRPSPGNRPGGLSGKKSPDGWYEMTDVELSETQIRGRAPFGSFLGGKPKLVIDRLTGDIQFGDFRGMCEKAATGPTEAKF
jgi:hypothetical protein